MPGLAVVTVVSRNYLAGARVLVNSLRAVAPDVPAWICLTDRPPATWRVEDEPAPCFFADELGIPDWRRVAFQYNSLELACALKPRAIRRLFDMGCERVLYVDADVRFYEPPRVWEEALSHSDMVLTPHLLDPLPDARPFDRETVLLRAGVYNGGLVAVRASAQGCSMLDWWTTRSHAEFHVDLAGGRHADQRWLDLVPGMFGGIHIERGPGVNAAFWRLWSRPLTVANDPLTNSPYRVDGQPLIAFHFSGFDPHQPDKLSAHDSAKPLGSPAALEQLLREYSAELRANGWDECRAWGNEFSHLSDGTPIAPYWRETIRWRIPEFAALTDPFAADPQVVARWRALAPEMRRWRIDWSLQDLPPLVPPPRPTRLQRFMRKLFGEPS